MEKKVKPISRNLILISKEFTRNSTSISQVEVRMRMRGKKLKMKVIIIMVRKMGELITIKM